MTNHLPARSTLVATLVASLFLFACSTGDDSAAMVAAAKESLAKKDAKTAVIQLKSSLQKTPDSAEARFILGKTFLEMGDVRAAAIELQKARDLNIDQEVVVPLLARALAAAGQSRKVTAEFAGIKLSSVDAKVDLMTTVATSNIAQGNLESGRSGLDAALQLKPNYARALFALAKLKLKKGDFDGALGSIDRAIEATPADPWAWALKGEIGLAQGNADAAQVALRKALEIQPENISANFSLINLLLQQDRRDEATKLFEVMKKAAPQFPQTIFLDARLAYLRKDYKSAGELTQVLLRFAPDSPVFLELSGVVKYEQGSYIQAEADLAKALQAQPQLMLARSALIQTYLRTGQQSKAIEALQPVMSELETRPQLQALAGEVYLQTGDLKRAEEYLSKAAKLDPKDVTKKTRLAQTHLAQGNESVAFTELEQIASGDSGSLADLALIASYLQKNDAERALKAIGNLEKKQPKDPQTYNLRGQVLLSTRNVSGARQSFEQALKLSPGYFPAAANLARLDLADKNRAEAEKRFVSVLAADPKNIQASLALAKLKEQGKSPAADIAALLEKSVSANPTEPAPRLALINFYLQAKDNKKALSAAQNALAAMPNNPEVTEIAGLTQQAVGEMNQAETTFGKLIGLQPRSAVPYFRLANVQAATGNKIGAAENLRKALQAKPDYVDAQRALIMLSVAGGKTREALDIAKEMQRQSPKSPSGHVFEGEIYVATKAFKEAASAYRTALKLSPATEVAKRLHASLLWSGNKPEADKFSASWTAEHPKDFGFRAHLADTAAGNRDFAGAIKIYRSLLELQPDNAQILNNLAWTATQIKDPSALEYAEKANRLSPDNPVFLDTLALALAEGGNAKKAVETERRAMELAKQSPPLRLNLAKILIKAGDKSQAKLELDELAKLGDKFAGQAEVSSLLRDLK